MRACSNKVLPDLGVIAEWSVFLEDMFDDMINYTSENPQVVRLEDWLDNHPMQYRDKIRQAGEKYAEDGWNVKKARYKGFPKIEKQFITQKDDPVKERMICGPDDIKKYKANAFINLMEKISMKCIPEYCGAKNWDEIAEDLSKFDAEIPDNIWAASDGSGFDMTQHYEILVIFEN